MATNFQDSHDEVLEVFLKHRKKEVTLDDFERSAHDSGYIEKAEIAFRASLQPAVTSQASIKMHSTMVQSAFRSFKSPRLVVLPRFDGNRSIATAVV